MDIKRAGSRPLGPGPADYFTTFAPGENHWHGATPTTSMTHIAIQEKRDGRAAGWPEQVSGEQYRRENS